MHQTDIVTLYDYNYWATRRIVGAAANLTAEHGLVPLPLQGLSRRVEAGCRRRKRKGLKHVGRRIADSGL